MAILTARQTRRDRIAEKEHLWLRDGRRHKRDSRRRSVELPDDTCNEEISVLTRTYFRGISNCPTTTTIVGDVVTFVARWKFASSMTALRDPEYQFVVSRLLKVTFGMAEVLATCSFPLPDWLDHDFVDVTDDPSLWKKLRPVQRMASKWTGSFRPVSMRAPLQIA